MTGASGLVGLAAARELRAHGHRVRALVHETPVSESVEDAMRGDLADEASLADAAGGVSAIVHAAARMAGSEEELDRINVAGTARLARVAARAGVGRFVLLGSAIIYAPGALVRARETAAIGAPGAYGVSKARAEEAARGILGDRVTVLRPCSVYRTGRCPIVETIASLAMRPELPLIGEGRTPIDLVHVDDLAQAVRLAVESPPRGQASPPPPARVYNVAGPAPAPFRSLLDAVAEVLGAAPRWVPDPRAARFDAFVLRAASEPRTLSIDRARGELGYEPVREWSIEIPRAVRAAMRE